MWISSLKRNTDAALECQIKIYDQNQEREIMSKDTECAQAVNFPTIISL